MNFKRSGRVLWFFSMVLIGVTALVGGDATYEVVAASEVQWAPLNPARGDQSPQAGTLWGDRKGEVPTGFLAKFVDGFSSPPHIHNATYRAVVIHGLIHNDDPSATAMWMPPGSFWTQPKGEPHITAAKGALNVALVEIDQGPYLVKPPAQGFDSGERPINIAASNVVWVAIHGAQGEVPGVQVAYLWGNPASDLPSGMFVKLPAGFVGTIHSQAATFRAVVISGLLRYQDAEVKSLDPGGYFGSQGDRKHPVAVADSGEVVLYVRSGGGYRVLKKSE